MRINGNVYPKGIEESNKGRVKHIVDKTQELPVESSIRKPGMSNVIKKFVKYFNRIDCEIHPFYCNKDYRN